MYAGIYTYRSYLGKYIRLRNLHNQSREDDVYVDDISKINTEFNIFGSSDLKFFLKVLDYIYCDRRYIYIAHFNLHAFHSWFIWMINASKILLSRMFGRIDRPLIFTQCPYRYLLAESIRNRDDFSASIDFPVRKSGESRRFRHRLAVFPCG